MVNNMKCFHSCVFLATLIQILSIHTKNSCLWSHTLLYVEFETAHFNATDLMSGSWASVLY